MKYDISARGSGKSVRLLKWLAESPPRPSNNNPTRAIVVAHNQRALHLMKLYSELREEKGWPLWDQGELVYRILPVHFFLGGSMYHRPMLELGVDDLSEVLHSFFHGHPVVCVNDRITDPEDMVPISQIGDYVRRALAAEGYDAHVAERVLNRVIYGSPDTPAEEEAQRVALQNHMA